MLSGYLSSDGTFYMVTGIVRNVEKTFGGSMQNNMDAAVRNMGQKKQNNTTQNKEN